ncbi:MAG: MFS transporter [Gammaproteobacteria bacterium]|nr:MFS transporter [Gammaproteobacteria bacterium]
MQNTKLGFLFLNVGHFLDHFFMLVFATAAALQLTQEWGLSYAELVPYATPGFIAFGIGAIPAGWMADKWSRQGMMVIFFIGIGLSSVLAAYANNPLQIALALTAIGLFAAIYHPVGLAMVVQGRDKTGLPLAINGIFGNLGVASAALITGFFIDASGWRSAFMLTGLLSVVIGLLYWAYVLVGNPNNATNKNQVNNTQATQPSVVSRQTLLRVFGIIFFTTALGGLIFQSTTFALPKIFAERLSDQTYSATLIGQYAFIVFSVAAFGQLVVGYLLDRYSLRMVFVWVAACQILFFAIMIQLTGTAVVLVGTAFMLAVFGQIPINDVLVGRMAQSEWRSRAYALRYIISFSVMASVVPLIAWIHGNWSFSVLFLVLAIAASFILFAVMFLPKLEPGATAAA